MNCAFYLFICVSLVGVSQVVVATEDSPTEVWFTSPVDHFNFADNRTFQQRCLVNASAWTPDTSAFHYVHPLIEMRSRVKI